MKERGHVLEPPKRSECHPDEEAAIAPGQTPEPDCLYMAKGSGSVCQGQEEAPRGCRRQQLGDLLPLTCQSHARVSFTE